MDFYFIFRKPTLLIYIYISFSKKNIYIYILEEHTIDLTPYNITLKFSNLKLMFSSYIFRYNVYKLHLLNLVTIQQI